MVIVGLGRSVGRSVVSVARWSIEVSQPVAIQRRGEARRSTAYSKGRRQVSRHVAMPPRYIFRFPLQPCQCPAAPGYTAGRSARLTVCQSVRPAPAALSDWLTRDRTARSTSPRSRRTHVLAFRYHFPWAPTCGGGGAAFSRMSAVHVWATAALSPQWRLPGWVLYYNSEFTAPLFRTEKAYVICNLYCARVYTYRVRYQYAFHSHTESQLCWIGEEFSRVVWRSVSLRPVCSMFAKLQQKCYVIDFFPDIWEKHAIVAVGLVYVSLCLRAVQTAGTR